MNKFPGPNRVADLMMPFLILLVILFVGRFIYSLITNEDYDDETVTVEFHCPTVLAMQENYPAFVINECKKLHER
jgi:hypothetical protein